MVTKKPKKFFGHLKKKLQDFSLRSENKRKLNFLSKNNLNKEEYSIMGVMKFEFLNPYYGFSEYFFGKEDNKKKIAYGVSIKQRMMILIMFKKIQLEHI